MLTRARASALKPGPWFGGSSVQRRLSRRFSCGEGIWRFGREGAPSGAKRVVIAGGVHGNERVGVEAVRWLVEELERSRHNMRGEVCVVLGNPKAVEMKLRATKRGEDLNRCFTDNDETEVKDSYEAERSKLIRPILESANVLLDIHATNLPSPAFVRIAGTGSKARETFGRIVKPYLHLPKILLLDPDHLIGMGKRSTTDEVRRLTIGSS